MPNVKECIVSDIYIVLARYTPRRMFGCWVTVKSNCFLNGGFCDVGALQYVRSWIKLDLIVRLTSLYVYSHPRFIRYRGMTIHVMSQEYCTDYRVPVYWRVLDVAGILKSSACSDWELSYVPTRYSVRQLSRRASDCRSVSARRMIDECRMLQQPGVLRPTDPRMIYWGILLRITKLSLTTLFPVCRYLYMLTYIHRQTSLARKTGEKRGWGDFRGPKK